MRIYITPINDKSDTLQMCSNICQDLLIEGFDARIGEASKFTLNWRNFFWRTTCCLRVCADRQRKAIIVHTPVGNRDSLDELAGSGELDGSFIDTDYTDDIEIHHPPCIFLYNRIINYYINFLNRNL